MQIANVVGLSRSERSNLEGPSLPRGTIRLDTSIGSFDSESLVQVESTIGKDEAHIVWATGDGALRVTSDWMSDSSTGVWRRSDSLQNTSRKQITVQRALARFVLAPGRYEVYSQSSQWCKENQGAWRPLQGSGALLRCEGGQTCRGASPFVCVREVEQKTGMAFHVLPVGNWTIRVISHTPRLSGSPFAIVELGLDDDHLRLSLLPKQSVDLPEILFYPLPDGDPMLSAPGLHRYLIERVLPPARRDPPVVYNTWFDVHEWFTTDRLRRQLAVARQIGCEVFVVDAGWYGAGAGGWQEQVGDWREKVGGAFAGRMADFAREVRLAGLGFGLWMEPERLHHSVPIVSEHPQWFLSSDGAHFYPNLDDEEAYGYILSEMARLIETYQLVWMKVDFNYERGIDASGAEYHSYYRQWYRLLGELRARFPAIYFEGCSSGGMRLDINTLSHFDGHFLSDTVTPLDVLRISQGALLRLPPGRISKWIVLSGPKNVAAGKARAPERESDAVVAPLGANWNSSVPTTVDFAAACALTGHFGVSGDLASLSKPALARLAYHIAFFKKWRNMLANCVGHLLTPPQPIEDGKGWAAIQLEYPQDTTSFLFVYRLDDPAKAMRFRLRGLNPKRSYTLIVGGRPLATLSGKQLMDEGVSVDIAERNSAVVLAITPGT